MPNGTGTTDCSYCVHYRFDKDEKESCDFWRVPIPRTPDHRRRFCTEYSPNEFYFQHTGKDRSNTKEVGVQEEFAAIGITLRPAILYGYFYNDPSSVIEVMPLRTEGHNV